MSLMSPAGVSWEPCESSIRSLFWHFDLEMSQYMSILLTQPNLATISMRPENKPEAVMNLL